MSPTMTPPVCSSHAIQSQPKADKTMLQTCVRRYADLQNQTLLHVLGAIPLPQSRSLRGLRMVEKVRSALP